MYGQNMFYDHFLKQEKKEKNSEYFLDGVSPVMFGLIPDDSLPKSVHSFWKPTRSLTNIYKIVSLKQM